MSEDNAVSTEAEEREPGSTHTSAQELGDITAQRLQGGLRKLAQTVGTEGGSSPVGGRNPTLRVCPFDDVGDGVLADAEVAGDPTVAPPAGDGIEHLRSKPV